MSPITTNEVPMDTKPKPEKVCLSCGTSIRCELNPRDGNWYRPAVSLIRIDPDWFFCSLRCAARYGVKKAKAGA